MQTWILSVSAMILLASVADIMLPEGRTNKIVRCVMSFACLFVLVAPLQKIAGGEFSFGDIFSNGSCEVQDTFLEYTFGEKVSALERDCEKMLSERDLRADRVTLYAENDDQIPAVYRAEVFGADGAQADAVANAVAEYFNINRTEVTVHGRTEETKVAG